MLSSLSCVPNKRPFLRDSEMLVIETLLAVPISLVSKSDYQVLKCHPPGQAFFPFSLTTAYCSAQQLA